MTIRRFREYRWDQVERLAYKEESEHFSAVTRQVLFGEALGLQAQLRYFEIAPGGYSTLERHRHAHGVMIVRGSGEVLVDRRIEAVTLYDLVSIPSMCWHQFRASRGEALGFLCLVNCERDRPQRPSSDDLADLRRDPDIAEFIRP